MILQYDRFFVLTVIKETDREKQLREEQKILESVAEKTGALCSFFFGNLFIYLKQSSTA